MPIIELIPLNKGNQVILDNTIITTIGRTPYIGCLDNKISRNHAQLFVKSDGTLWIKSIHHNPTFYKTKTNQIVRLTKDKEYQLFNNDEFGLLPHEYFYRVSIKSKDEDVEKISNHTQTINSSTIPKSPIKENEISTIENHEEEEIESISDKNRTLPSWMSNSSASSSTYEKKLSNEKTVTTPPGKEGTNPEEKKTNQIVYDIDDNDESAAKASSTEQAGTSNNIDKTIHNGTSSTNVNSTKRERCSYGESCFRKNPIHRQQAIHPGDSDWENEEEEEEDKNKTKPECPYGNECYRKNPDHFNEYHHPKKRSIEIKTKQRSTKRKAIEDDDDDGLPNEYDYNDSFIDNEDLDSTDGSTDEEKTDDDDDDIEWKPHKNSRYLNESDDDSTDDSDKELAKKEADEFIQGSTANHHGPLTKKPRVDDD